MSSQRVHWCVTHNNFAQDHLLKWVEFAESFCEVFRGQEERGENGTPHLQIYFKLSKARRFNFIKEKIGDNGLHCEVARDPAKAWAYCGKPESRVDGGWSHQRGDGPTGRGHRTDLSSLRSAIETGGLAGAFEADFESAIRYARGIQLFYSLSLSERRRERKTRVWVFYGPPGVGKSSLAHAISSYLGSELYVKLCSDRWFDHYDPMKHKAVLLDDFVGTIPFSQLLAIMDRGQCFVEVKGGTVPWLVEDLFITSNVRPDQWYNFDENKKIVKEAMFRRFDYVWDGTFEDGGLMPLPPLRVPRLTGDARWPVILDGHHVAPKYSGNGQWDMDDIVIEEESE